MTSLANLIIGQDWGGSWLFRNSRPPYASVSDWSVVWLPVTPSRWNHQGSYSNASRQHNVLDRTSLAVAFLRVERTVWALSEARDSWLAQAWTREPYFFGNNSWVRDRKLMCIPVCRASIVGLTPGWGTRILTNVWFVTEAMSLRFLLRFRHGILRTPMYRMSFYLAPTHYFNYEH